MSEDEYNKLKDRRNKLIGLTYGKIPSHLKNKLMIELSNIRQQLKEAHAERYRQIRATDKQT